MPFAIIGFLLGTRHSAEPFSLKLFLLVILCMISARSAAMAFNRYIDKDIDAANPRTKIREIPSGIIKPNNALIFVIASSLFFISCTYFINPLCFYLSPVALLVVLGYSLSKRFTWLCHFILGVGLSLAPIGAYIAVTGEFNLLPVIYSIAVLNWVAGFDIIYALQDEDFDKEQQLKSVPALMGKKNALLLSTVLHLITFSLVIYAGFLQHATNFYWIGTTLFSGLLFYQHLIVKPNDLSRVNLAFFTTNGIASVVFSIFFVINFYN
jgi:4-hydroxybenzoate polyprenyltransferase